MNKGEAGLRAEPVASSAEQGFQEEALRRFAAKRPEKTNKGEAGLRAEPAV